MATMIAATVAAAINSRDAIAASRRLITLGPIGLTASWQAQTSPFTIQGVRGRLRKRGAKERSGNHITWIMDAGVNTRISDKRGKAAQWDPRDWQHSCDTGSEGESGRRVP